MLKTITINIGIFLIGLLLVEVLFGNWTQPDRLNTLYILKNIKRDYDVSQLYKNSSGKAHYTRDQHGLRGIITTPREVQILTLGGSTTDQRYIDDRETWQSVITQCLEQKKITLPIANAGIDGQSSFGHIVALEQWLKKIPELKPKYVLVYLGSNDFRTSEALLPTLNSETTLYSVWFQKSVLAFFVKTLVGNYLANKGQVFHQPVDHTLIKWSQNHNFDNAEQISPFIEEKRSRYQERLKHLVEAIKNWNAAPILVSQWDFVAKRQDGHIVAVARTSEVNGQKLIDMDHYFLMQAFHQATATVATEQRVTYWDASGELIFDESDFYDIVHNSPSGARKLGNYLCEKLSSVLK